MKPLWLEIEGYKSYREKQRVDFEALGRDGLFGIFGRTGSGKSSILDAVIFALFGGGRDLGSLINSVCKSARVSFAFNMLTADGRKTFEALRGITRNKDGSVNTSECRFIRYDGSHPVVLASDRTEQMNEAVRSVLKLDKEEFSKTVVLPQGQFADFLRLGSAARNDILEKIFMLDKYGTLLESRAKQEKEVLKERSIQMGQIIQECAYAADAELARQKEAVSAGKAAGEMLEKQAKDAEAFFTVMTEAYKNTCELETLLARAGELAQQAGEMTKIKAACLQAEKAERALPFIKAYSEAKMACDKAAGEKEGLQKSFLPAEERMKAASAMFETAEKNRGENMKLGQLSVALEDYIKFQVNAENIKKEAEKARGFAAALQIEFEQADTRAKKLETGLNKLKEKNYAIFAASRLEEGMPCPVCGSTSHPDKAEGAMLDARALELQANEAKETAEGVRKRLDEARGKVEGLLGKAHEAGNNMDAVLSRLAGLSPEAKTLDPDRARAILEGTRRRLKQITEDFSAASNEKDNGEKVFNTLKQQLAAAENAEKIYTAGLKKAETECKRALDDNGFVAKEEAEKAALPRETLQSYKSSIEEYDKAKTGIEAKIEAAEKKTSRKVKAEEYEQAKCSREQAVKLLQESIKKLAMLESDLKKTEKDNEKLQKTLREQKKAEQELSYLEELLKAIRGKAFVEFAAGRMMDLIVREASHHLQKLAYGRYEFLYNYSTGFFVRDNFNGGMERSAATLSGGETFLVSLTLALALASHISRQSHPFEFFFLDEGFGTLDAGLLETVMDTLETLRSENLTVGLITHNEEIQRRIFNKLIVEQPDPVRGSTLRLEKA